MRVVAQHDSLYLWAQHSRSTQLSVFYEATPISCELPQCAGVLHQSHYRAVWGFH